MKSTSKFFLLILSSALASVASYAALTESNHSSRLQGTAQVQGGGSSQTLYASAFAEPYTPWRARGGSGSSGGVRTAACPAPAPDRDGDGVCDDVDNCPDVANPLQEDSNGNGIGDACDPCTANRPPFFTSTPACDSVFETSVGVPVSFSVTASDSDATDTLNLNASGVPAGATLTPPVPARGHPVMVTFAWTPDTTAVGDHVVTFQATDSCQASLSCAFTVRVVANHPPDCSLARVLNDELWPPNHKLVPVTIEGITDPDGDPVHLDITGITQDEAEDGEEGDSCRTGQVVDGVAYVRAERSGHGNGRVYIVSFMASDGNGGTCNGQVSLCVPHDQGRHHSCVDDGLRVNALHACSGASTDAGRSKRAGLEVLAVRGTVAQLQYTVPVESNILLAVYSVTGRLVARIAQGREPAGTRDISWDARNVQRGIYFVNLKVGGEMVTKRLFIGK